MNIAVLGSAFDPPTLGHIDVIKQCLDAFDEVWLVPSYSHAFNKKMSPYFHRAEMTKAFAKDINNTQVKIVACEPKIKPNTSGPVYSLDLLNYLKELEPKHQYSLVIGPDNHAAFDKFYKADKLKTEFSPFIADERTTIRSTLVRETAKKNISINSLVSAKVCRYIHEHNLYSSSL